MPGLANIRQTPGRTAVTLGALLCASAAVFAGLVLVGPLPQGARLFAMASWFTVPVVWLATPVYGPAPGRVFAAALVGPVWGSAVSSVVRPARWLAGLRGPMLLAAPAAALLILTFAGLARTGQD